MTDKNILTVLSEANKVRQTKWKGSENLDMNFRALELCEEVGEVAGAVKKLYRARNGVIGNTKPESDIVENLIEEVGDVLICLDLLADKTGINLTDALIEKFNKTSTKHGIDVHIARSYDNNFYVTTAEILK